MISNEEYNSIILNFYSNAYLQASCVFTDKEQINQRAMELTHNFADSFHSGIAKSYLKELEKKYPSLKDKLQFYPSQFWTTRFGENYFIFLLQKITDDSIALILEAKENNEKLDVNMLVYVVNDLMLIYERDLKEGKKQLLKIKKELTSNKKIRNLDIDFMQLLKEAFEKHEKKHNLLKQVLSDFALMS